LEVLVNQIYVGIFIVPDVSILDAPGFEALQTSSYNATPTVRRSSRSEGELLQPLPQLDGPRFNEFDSDDDRDIAYQPTDNR